MKQGLPVIGRRGTGIDGKGQAGQDYEVIGSDAESLGFLKDLLNNIPRCSALAEAGQRLAANWTLENSALQHMAIYKELIQRKVNPM